MRNRIPTRALVAGAALALLANVATAGKPAVQGKTKVEVQCLQMDLQVARVQEGFEARLAVQWNCTREDLYADLSIQANGFPLKEARIEGASQALLRVLLDPAQIGEQFELCGRVEGEAIRGRKVRAVAGQECHLVDLGQGQDEPPADQTQDDPPADRL